MSFSTKTSRTFDSYEMMADLFARDRVAVAMKNDERKDALVFWKVLIRNANKEVVIFTSATHKDFFNDDGVIDVVRAKAQDKISQSSPFFKIVIDGEGGNYKNTKLVKLANNPEFKAAFEVSLLKEEHAESGDRTDDKGVVPLRHFICIDGEMFRDEVKHDSKPDNEKIRAFIHFNNKEYATNLLDKFKLIKKVAIPFALAF